jgi:hypothetical protein
MSQKKKHTESALLCTPGLIPINGNRTCSGLKQGCVLDHGSCLFEKTNERRWPATEIFSLVEVNPSEKACMDFQVERNGSVSRVDLEDQHAALGQAIMYTMGGVLLYHARNGVLRDADEETDPEVTQDRVGRRDDQQKERKHTADGSYSRDATWW